MSSAPASGPVPARLTLWDEEDFQGRRCRLLSDCANISERGGLRRVRSVKVENGAWVAFEYPDFQGEQFILEKGDYPRWSAWSSSGSHQSNQLLSFRPASALCGPHAKHVIGRSLALTRKISGKLPVSLPQLNTIEGTKLVLL